jgi:hypothetical protein
MNKNVYFALACGQSAPPLRGEADSSASEAIPLRIGFAIRFAVRCGVH